MRTKFIGATALLSALFICLACSNKSATAIPNGPTKTSQDAAGELKFKAPDGWTSEKSSSLMRVAQYKLPKVEGDKEDASLVLYYFGASQGGTAQANIDRWIGQMQQPDGSDSKSKSKTDSLTVNGLKVTTVDVTGTYTAEMAPGSGTFHNDENYRLRAAVIETPKGNYFVKLAGPAKTIGRWDKSYNDYLKSFEFK
ncbi:MAG TPA: hypothetical protein VHQ64_15210 [Pyrinomonadaceae bacterium]|jgi:hypothetical protein|nr:hypothetical protein [Pyrinomonadaceae bacterium]